jgi:hypothetical protein
LVTFACHLRKLNENVSDSERKMAKDEFFDKYSHALGRWVTKLLARGSVSAWLILFAYAAALPLALLLHTEYYGLLAGLGALVIVSLVILGFVLQPCRDVFYLRMTIPVFGPDHFSLEHERIAVRVELARLWLLFVPTFAALALLVVDLVEGLAWWVVSETDPRVDFVQWIVLIIVFGLLATWVRERWILRDANACCADFAGVRRGRVSYGFKDPAGEYFGGIDRSFGRFRSPELARVVFYRPTNPDLNKISGALLFHRLVIIGRGLTELDEATAVAHSLQAQPASKIL